MYIPIPSGQNNLRSIIPPRAQEGGTEEMFKRLQNISLRDRLVRDIENGIDGWYDHYTAVGKDWSRMQPVSFSNAAYKKYNGKRMDVILADIKKPPRPARNAGNQGLVRLFPWSKGGARNLRCGWRIEWSCCIDQRELAQHS
jgi:hypothetical protein